MKLATVLALSLCLASFTLPTTAQAEEVEARAATALRERPSASAKIVERLPAGASLSIVQMGDDGWARVRAKNGREGWVPVASLRARPEGAPAEEDSLAKRRNVRAESWVSKSQYHQQDEKMTVVANQAELFGRPQAGGTVLGIVRRGEVVLFVRRSADKKWVQIDIGAGELAWVEAQAVRMGADMPRSTPEGEEPPPPRSPAEVRRAEDREAAPSEEPPLQPRRRRTEEQAPAVKRPTRGGRSHGNNYLDARAKLGFAAVGEQVRTNGTSTTLLRNYEHGTTGLAIGLQLGYSRAFGKLRLHLDLKYLIAALGSVVYRQSDTVSTQLQILDQNIGGGLAVGGFFDVAGGIDLRLRLGVDTWVNQISASAPPLTVSSDIVLGMAIGLELGMPEPLHVADRPIGFRVKVGAIAPATRIQQPNIVTTPESSTVGAYVGASVHFGVLRPSPKGQLHIELSYDFSYASSHFTGVCPPTTATSRTCRDDSVTDASYSSRAHVGGLGVYYQY